jgi:hypothetical protein
MELQIPQPGFLSMPVCSKYGEHVLLNDFPYFRMYEAGKWNPPNSSNECRTYQDTHKFLPSKNLALCSLPSRSL